jgi:beta-1,4-mannosyl-glycoprotein beta-1,4-N-acetylglucosaminyltransferase
MRIFDVFSFFNELDLLEIRLNVLDSCVDYFVIVESRETFSGIKKPLYYQENEFKFKKWNNKIIHYVMEDYPNDTQLYEKAKISLNTGNGDEYWLREFYQKEAPMRALEPYCQEEDVIFLSDLDEIWNPKIKYNIEHNKVYRPIQTSYPFYLNNRSNQDVNCWTGTRIGKYKTLKKYGANHFRTEREVESIKIPNGGWHFSWTDKKEKYKACNSNDVQYRFKMVSMEKTWKDESELPEYIINNKQELIKKGLMLP